MRGHNRLLLFTSLGGQETLWVKYHNGFMIIFYDRLTRNIYDDGEKIICGDHVKKICLPRTCTLKDHNNIFLVKHIMEW